MLLQANFQDSKVSIDGEERVVPNLPITDYRWIWYDSIKGTGEYQQANDFTISGTFNDRNLVETLATAWVSSAKTTPAPDIEMVRAGKRTEINNARDNAEISGFPYLGKIFDSTQRSVSRLSTAAFAASVAISQGQSFSIDWTTMDNSVITMNASEMVGAPIALAQYALSLHQKAKTLKSALDLATTIEQINAIQW